MRNFIFNKASHVYLLDGVPIPSVTTILKEAGLSNLDMVDPEVLKRNAEFGNAIHATIDYRYKGTLNASTVPPEIKSHVSGWDNFVEDFGYMSRKSEISGYHPGYRYGYTMDQLGEITKGKYLGATLADIKTGRPAVSHRYQMGGYKLAAGKEYKNVVLVYLDPSYKPRGYKVEFAINNKREQGVFLSALSLYNVKKEHRII